MSSVVVFLLVLGCGWRAYRDALRDGTWSNKQFLLTLLAAFGLCAVVSLPFFLISPETMQAHEGLAITSIVAAIFAGVTVITIYSNRWRKRNQLKRSGQNRAAAIAIIALFLFGARASAQTTYRDPQGNFSVMVPAGWKAHKDSVSSQVTISQGAASVSFDISPTDDGSTPPANDVLHSIAQQVVQQCPQPDVVKRGETTLAGQPAVSVKIACKDPQKGTALTTIAVATMDGKVLVGNMTAYAGEDAGVNAAMAGIIGSIRLGSAPNPAPALHGNSDSGPNQQKLKALEGACSAGVFTAEECAAKRAALTQQATPSGSSGNSAQLQALKRACDAGVFTPAECQAKQAAISGSGSNAGPAPNPGAPVWQTNDPNAMPPQSGAQTAVRNDTGRQQAGDSSGNLYQDPHGAFSIMIPQGWTAKAKSGCYGPDKNCPPNASGVNIQSPGRSWAFLAPFSEDANQPTDVVNRVAQHIRSDYQNVEVLQNDPEKLNGLNVAVGHFSATDDGEPVSLVVIGIAAPNGRYFVAESSVPQSEMQSAGTALSSMPGTLRFAGQ